MSRAVLVALLFAACGHPAATPDAAADAAAPDAHLCVGPTRPRCTQTCGNGVVDECAKLTGVAGEQCGVYQNVFEACDGSDVPTSCTDVGYYGGTSACGSQCTVDDHGCDACAVACTSYASGVASIAAVSGTQIGVSREPFTMTSSWTFAILDASLNEVAAANVIQPSAVIGVPDGWLLGGWLISGTTVTHVDRAGMVGPSMQLWSTGGTVTGMAYGPGGRALAVWSEYIMPDVPRIWAALLDTDGTVAVAPFVLFDESTDPELATATTDGTSFFVAAKGQLVRVVPDGTVDPIVTGFPIRGSLLANTPIAVSWSGATGWYIVQDDLLHGSYTAQQFDATGAKVGAAITITGATLTQLQAYGSGLVGASVSHTTNIPWRFSAVRFDASGSRVASTEVGVTTLEPPLVLPFGSGVIANWYGAGHVQFALVTP